MRTSTSFPPGTRVTLPGRQYSAITGTVVVCMCKRHAWQPDISARECGCDGADDTCPWPLHVRWDRVYDESHENDITIIAAPTDA
jgi:hypothetical protein